MRLATLPRRDATEPLLDQPNNFVLITRNRSSRVCRLSGQVCFNAFRLRRPIYRGLMTITVSDSKIRKCTALFGVPCPTHNSPLLIEPGTDFSVLNVPGFNLPPTVHDDYLEFHWLAKINDFWGLRPDGYARLAQRLSKRKWFASVSVGIARGGVYTWSDNLKIAVGAAYWGRFDANVVPAGGILWTPNADTRFELITPKPRIAYRMDCGQSFERWAYIAGEFGGGQWAIEQTPGFDNELKYSDYRVMLGMEHKSLDLGLNGFAGIRLCVRRQLQYQYVLPDQNLPSTMMVPGLGCGLGEVESQKSRRNRTVNFYFSTSDS